MFRRAIRGGIVRGSEHGRVEASDHRRYVSTSASLIFDSSSALILVM
jgi:hypothetical protein